MNDNYSYVFITFKTGPMRMASHFQKLKLLASFFLSNINLIIFRISPANSLYAMQMNHLSIYVDSNLHCSTL